jgi:hypothetical protein
MTLFFSENNSKFEAYYGIKLEGEEERHEYEK